MKLYIIVEVFRQLKCLGNIMAKNLTRKLIESHLVAGDMVAGEEIGLKIDQTLTQDATGTMVMLELEAMNCFKVKTELSAQYVDHNILQTDFKNADDHLFLQSACQRFGIWYSRAGNGVSHPVHMERFGIPGKTMLGSDSHTCAAGSLGMLAIGAGGLEVALAMMGKPFYETMPSVFGVRLVGKLPKFVSAKDIILEMLRRHGVEGGVKKIFEYYGPGLLELSAMDRHVIANMGTELGATTTVFPSDEITRSFLQSQDRANDWSELKADDNASYDQEDEIDLCSLEPLIACPSSPDNVVPVGSVKGKKIYQAMIGSSANPGLRDFAIPAMMLLGKKIHPNVSFDVNPTSRQILENMVKEGYLKSLIHAGARIHQAGCNGCIGMGQAPATKKISLRTAPRNFPGRSGTKEDLVYLCSPETATASALTGEITDPRDLSMDYPQYQEPKIMRINDDDLLAPRADDRPELVMGPNIKPLPKFDALKDKLQGPIVLKMGNNISTDEILPAGSRILPLRSNVPEIAKFAFSQIEKDFYQRVNSYEKADFFIIAGKNYGQGSSREHAAIVTKYLGVNAVIAKSYARIHRGNLVNFGVIPFIFANDSDLASIDGDDVLLVEDVKNQVTCQKEIYIKNQTKKKDFIVYCPLSRRNQEILFAGGLIQLLKKNLDNF
jgi:aconitate hydratase